MRLWLDDERPAPDGWHATKDAAEALSLIRSGKVVEASLDHDLGNEPYNGYWILKSVEEDLARGVRYSVPTISIHTANPVGRRNMRAALESIQRLASK
ncbi:MAG TPA: cyclic-phosphate processing receiver domain-containing protein [Gaiellaceae bacterium]|nr:cyclic-phosphate processing receiver domain-containing protein [Gaiellaceae bacterium]